MIYVFTLNLCQYFRESRRIKYPKISLTFSPFSSTSSSSRRTHAYRVCELQVSSVFARQSGSQVPVYHSECEGSGATWSESGSAAAASVYTVTSDMCQQNPAGAEVLQISSEGLH